MPEKYHTVTKNKVFSNPFWEYLLDKYVLPDNSIGDYHYIETNGSTMIIPINEKNEIIMVKQYRYLNKMFSWEFPGGGVKKNNDYLKNAQEELIEETGYFSDNLKFIGEFNPFNGVTNEICKVFLADNLIKKEASPESSEEFEIGYFSIDEIIQLINTKEIWDGMSLAAFSLLYFSDYFKEFKL